MACARVQRIEEGLQGWKTGTELRGALEGRMCPTNEVDAILDYDVVFEVLVLHLSVLVFRNSYYNVYQYDSKPMHMEQDTKFLVNLVLDLSLDLFCPPLGTLCHI